jgi:DNA invertase Pin-like site-specific DNA recombinase
MRTPRNAVSYVRVSGLGQRDGDGPERQRDAIARAAKKAKLSLVGEFSDLGVSGKVEGLDRPGVVAMLAAIGSLGASVVLVERADRLARDVLVSELLLKQCRDMGVQVLTADGVDLTAADADATTVLIRQVLSAVAQFDRASTVLKLKVARDRKRAATGRCEGVRPFGELEGEGEALAALRALARKQPGCDAPTMAEVATKANEAGIRSRSGKPWTRGTVWNVLRAS